MKHSPNFAKWLKKPRHKYYKRVYLLKRDDAGHAVTEWKPHVIYIGYADDVGICGARLSSILCGDFQTWAFMFRPSAYTEITEEFWQQYERDGRCTFDRDHSMYFQNSDDRFTELGNTRRCNWCGQWHRQEIEKNFRIERRQVWKPTEALIAA